MKYAKTAKIDFAKRDKIEVDNLCKPQNNRCVGLSSW
jgi:hypothetical protein